MVSSGSAAQRVVSREPRRGSSCRGVPPSYSSLQVAESTLQSLRPQRRGECRLARHHRMTCSLDSLLRPQRCPLSQPCTHPGIRNQTDCSCLIFLFSHAHTETNRRIFLCVRYTASSTRKTHTHTYIHTHIGALLSHNTPVSRAY